MDLFTYLMAKNNQNTHKDLFSYLLGKGSGGGGTYTTYTGTSLNISNTIKAKIKNFMLNSTELTQDGTPSPSSPVDVNVIKNENNIKITDGIEEQNYPISLGNLEYCKIGNYADQIFKNTTDSLYYDNTLAEGDWYLKKNIGKVIFNGTESWEIYTDNVFSYEKITNIRNCLSDYYVFNSTERIGRLLDGQFGIANSANGNRICFKNQNCSTITDFKTWLSTHNTIVYYPLETSTYIHISQEDYPILKAQLENLYNNAKSYNGQTNITQTNDDLPFNISVDVKVANL